MSSDTFVVPREGEPKAGSGPFCSSLGPKCVTVDTDQCSRVAGAGMDSTFHMDSPWLWGRDEGLSGKEDLG